MYELIAENPTQFSDIEAFKDFRLISLEDMTLLGAPVIGSQAMEVTLKENTPTGERDKQTTGVKQPCWFNHPQEQSGYSADAIHNTHVRLCWKTRINRV